MSFRAVILTVLLLVAVSRAGGQTGNKPCIKNARDAQGNPTGWWKLIIPAKKGEPERIMYGEYMNGQKTGRWYTLDRDYDLTAIENYRYDVLDGEVKYYDQGKLSCIGHYRGLNPANKYDTIVVTDPVTGLESYASIPTEHSSLRHGMWYYYDTETGRLVKEEEYQVDSLIYHKDYLMSHADSVSYERRMNNMPHVKGIIYTPSPKKQVSYLDY